MGRADCIGQNRRMAGYIFDMRICGRMVWPGLALLVLALMPLRADPADVPGAHDHPLFSRQPGFVITDYDEDNPAEFDFSVARPLPIDANHIVPVHVKGHRYVIRYEVANPASAPTLLQTQQYYEKLATAAGFLTEKTGAVGDVTETFYRAGTKNGRDVWMRLEPAGAFYTLTVVDSKSAPPPPSVGAPKDASKTAVAAATTNAAPVAPPTASASTEDALYNALMKDGRVILPVTFLPGKSDLTPDSQPVIDRVAAILKAHPEMLIRIEGYTDNTGDADFNVSLSADRAIAVRSMLVAAHIPKSRMVSVGHGGIKPVADNSTADGREKNRRIELVVRQEAVPSHAPAPNGQNYYPPSAGSTP